MISAQASVSYGPRGFRVINAIRARTGTTRDEIRKHNERHNDSTKSILRDLSTTSVLSPPEFRNYIAE